MSTTADSLRRSFARKLALLIEARFGTQAELVRRSGLKQTTVQRLCDAKGHPRLYHAAAIARAGDLPLDWFVGPADAPVPDAAGPRELQVREMAARLGWDEVYWRVVGARGEAVRGAVPAVPPPPRGVRTPINPGLSEGAAPPAPPASEPRREEGQPEPGRQAEGHSDVG
jgi:hypothetical protein